MREEYNFDKGVKNAMEDPEISIYNMLAKFKEQNLLEEYHSFTKDMNLLIKELDRHKLINENDLAENIVDVFDTVSKLEVHQHFLNNITNNEGELICAMFLGLIDNEN